MVTYGFKVVWHPRLGYVHEAEVGGLDTPEAAEKAGWAAAVEFGYRPPKWFEYWRWLEPRSGSKTSHYEASHV